MAWINTGGFQDELGFWGGTHVFNSRGELVLLLPQNEELLSCFDLHALDSMPVVADWRWQLGSEEGLMKELDSALGLYLKDYFRKSGLSGKVLLGLSGGIDSSVVATAAAKHLGPANVLGVRMPSRFNSHQEMALAVDLAANLKITLRDLPIEPYLQPIEAGLGAGAGSLAHENLQARLRALMLWTIANQEDRVVLNTTNWTEAAMGYGTIGGDLLGLPLIASLPKTWVYRLARYYKDSGFPSITQAHLDIAPTAALKPDQSDESSFGARYWVLDAVLEDLFMNYGDLEKTKQKLQTDTNLLQRYQPINGIADKPSSLAAVIDRCAQALLKQTEFKRWYYNRTPQFTPYAWLRWRWPLANAQFLRD